LTSGQGVLEDPGGESVHPAFHATPGSSVAVLRDWKASGVTTQGVWATSPSRISSVRLATLFDNSIQKPFLRNPLKGVRVDLESTFRRHVAPQVSLSQQVGSVERTGTLLIASGNERSNSSMVEAGVGPASKPITLFIFAATEQA